MQITCCNFLQESKKWSEMNVAHTHTHTCIPHTHSGRQAHTHAANVFAPSGNKNKFEKLILNVLHWKHIVWQPPTLRHLFTLTLSLCCSASLLHSLSLSFSFSPFAGSLFARLSLRLRWFSTCLADNQAKPLSPSLLPCTSPSPRTHPHIKTATRRRRASVRGLSPLSISLLAPPGEASIRWP